MRNGDCGPRVWIGLAGQKRYKRTRKARVHNFGHADGPVPECDRVGLARHWSEFDPVLAGACGRRQGPIDVGWLAIARPGTTSHIGCSVNPALLWPVLLDVTLARGSACFGNRQ